METFTYKDLLKDLENNKKVLSPYKEAFEGIDSNEGLKDFIYGVFDTFDNILTGVSNLFLDFANRNFHSVNIYIRELEDKKKELQKVVNGDPKSFLKIENEVIGYIDGCVVDINTLASELLKGNKLISSDYLKALEYTNKIISMTIGDLEYRQSNRPVKDKEYGMMLNLKNDLEKIIKKCFDANKYKDNAKVKDICGSVSNLTKAMSDLQECSKLSALKDIKKFIAEHKESAEKIELIIEQVKNEELDINHNKMKYLGEVVETMANITTYYSAITGNVIEAIKTCNSIIYVLLYVDLR